MSPAPLPYYTIPSRVNGVFGYGPISASTATDDNDNVATLHAALIQTGVGGLEPADTDMGSFLGLLRFNIKNANILTDASTAGFEFYRNINLGRISIKTNTGADVPLSNIEFVNATDFAVRGITVLNPTAFQTVNRYPAVPYASMGSNLGYPIYFERSGLLEPSVTLGVYGTPRYAYKIEYSLNGGATFIETGRVAETRMRSSEMSDANRLASYSGMVDYFSETLDYYITTGNGQIIPNDVPNMSGLVDQPFGPGLFTMGYGGVLRVI
jgi:hypothetical protein